MLSTNGSLFAKGRTWQNYLSVWRVKHRLKSGGHEASLLTVLRQISHKLLHVGTVSHCEATSSFFGLQPEIEVMLPLPASVSVTQAVNLVCISCAAEGHIYSLKWHPPSGVIMNLRSSVLQ